MAKPKPGSLRNAVVLTADAAIFPAAAFAATRLAMLNRRTDTDVIVFTVAVFLFEAHAGAPMIAPEHCGFWTTIDAGLSCR